MRSIIRVRHDKDRPFLTVSKDTVRDNNTSFEVRGFLMYLLANPDDWQVRPEEIAKECGLHFTTVYRLLNKLIKAGYVNRQIIKRRKPDGTFDSGSLYTVYEGKEGRELDSTAF